MKEKVEKTLLKRLVLVEDLEYKKLYVPLNKITSSRDFVDFAKKHLYPKDRINVVEIFTAVFIDRGNIPIGFTQYRGNISGVTTDIMEIVSIAISLKAAGVFLCHNHTSGRILPSNSDNNLTLNFKKALEPLDIHLIDHIIITENSYYSYSDEGELSNYSNCTYYVMGKAICNVLLNGESISEYMEGEVEPFGLFKFIEGITLSRELADALLGYEDFQTVTKETFEELLKYK